MILHVRVSKVWRFLERESLRKNRRNSTIAPAAISRVPEGLRASCWGKSFSYFYFTVAPKARRLGKCECSYTHNPIAEPLCWAKSFSFILQELLE